MRNISEEQFTIQITCKSSQKTRWKYSDHYWLPVVKQYQWKKFISTSQHCRNTLKIQQSQDIHKDWLFQWVLPNSPWWRKLTIYNICMWLRTVRVHNHANGTSRHTRYFSKSHERSTCRGNCCRICCCVNRQYLYILWGNGRPPWTRKENGLKIIKI